MAVLLECRHLRPRLVEGLGDRCDEPLDRGALLLEVRGRLFLVSREILLGEAQEVTAVRIERTAGERVEGRGEPVAGQIEHRVALVLHVVTTRQLRGQDFRAQARRVDPAERDQPGDQRAHDEPRQRAGGGGDKL